ncbi:alpha/beta fold hydrolase [Methylocella sp.]|uniref:alpha/beta fold hydrolase n=1 Tax=Methylocella sp. TaxID=1978226 RepID=UPI003C2807A0
MFETLMPLHADRYHLIAPDYPGIGASDAPAPAGFAYTFDHLAAVVGAFAEALDLKSYVLVHAGLWRTGGLSPRAGASGARAGPHHPERCRA